MRKIVCVGWLCLCVVVGMAQAKKDSTKVKRYPILYFSQCQAGGLFEGKEITFSTRWVNGILLGKKARVGFSTGLDSYAYWQTLPLSAFASWDIVGNRNRHALFIQTSGGWSHVWFIKTDAFDYPEAPYTSAKGGLFINPQLGFRYAVESIRLMFLVGYTFQRFSFDKRGNWYYDYQQGTAVLSMDRVRQTMQRVQVSIAVGWR